MTPSRPTTSDDPVGIRVRAVMNGDAIFVHLGDLIGYVEASCHDVPDAIVAAISSLLHQLGEALESD